jgi:hypothetical protein
LERPYLLHFGDSVDRKADLAVRQVVFPRAHEARIETERFDARPRMQEGPASLGEHDVNQIKLVPAHRRRRRSEKRVRA